MEKLNTKPTVNEAPAKTPATDNTKSEEFKAKKREAAARFAEKQKQRKEDAEKHSKILLDLNEQKKWNLPADTVKWLQDLANPQVVRSTGNSTFNIVFGASPKVGDKISLLQFMQKTLKGVTHLQKYMKQWEEKGIIVECIPAKDAINNEYVIRSMKTE